MKTHHIIKALGIATCVAFCGMPAGCSGDDGTEPAGGGGGGDTAAGGTPATGGEQTAVGGYGADVSIYDALGIDPPPEDTPNFDFSSVEAPYEDVDGCKAFHDDYTETRDCICDNCFDLMQQCDALDGCIEMMDCGLEMDCTDENDCYFGGKCTEVYDRWGNTGVSTALARRIGTCQMDSACPRPTAPTP